jgi:glycosyltransferase involved in cell wall biosynthesis
MSQPLVSIVLPTYKRAHLLAQAMQSVLDQTYANLELIIVDDNSPDNTAEVVSAFNDPRIQYVKNDPNLKLPRALNRGFSLARGDYLTWTSDDNLLAPTAIEKMVARLDKGDCDFVYADYWLFSEQDANGLPMDIHHDKLPDRLQLEKGNHIGACFMYTRKLYEQVGDYDPELFLVEDYDYFIRAARAFQFCHISEPLYYFRRDDDTLFLSRFPEVKASDVLIRHKNDLLNESKFYEVMVDIIMRRMAGLKHPLLRNSHGWLKGRSYRLTTLLNGWIARYLKTCAEKEVGSLVREYRSGTATFKDTRNALVEFMQRHGTIEY